MCLEIRIWHMRAANLANLERDIVINLLQTCLEIPSSGCSILPEIFFSSLIHCQVLT